MTQNRTRTKNKLTNDSRRERWGGGLERTPNMIRTGPLCSSTTPSNKMWSPSAKWRMSYRTIQLSKEEHPSRTYEKVQLSVERRPSSIEHCHNVECCFAELTGSIKITICLYTVYDFLSKTYHYA